MEWMYVIKIVTLALCWINYIAELYRTDWEFGNTGNVGWLMGVLGWTSVVLNG